jgi:Golgi phosphoprotein 3
MLTFAEELLLLSHDEKSGTFGRLPDLLLSVALAGATLMDLALLNRIDTDLTKLMIHDRAPTGEKLLDSALGSLATLGTTTTTAQALEIMRKNGASERGALERLVERGILREQGGRVLWVFETKRYPLIDGKELLDVKRRIAALLLSDAIPDPRDVVIIALAQACGLLNRVFSEAEIKRATPRIEQIAKLDLIGQEVRSTMQELSNAIISALTM